VGTSGIEQHSAPSSARAVAPALATARRIWQRFRWQAAVVGLGLLTVLTRLPFRDGVPFNADSVNYSLALSHFNLATDQPHPPGNPLYVLLGRLAYLAIPDPNRALIAISMLTSVVAVCAVAYLGAQLGSRAAGLWAAAFLAVNPFFWLNGEVALAYTTETMTALVLALVAWQSYRKPSVGSAVGLGAILAVAGGLRPTLLPLLAPLYLFGLWRTSWRDRSLSLTAAAITTLGWLVPLIALSGGVSTYVDLVRRQAVVAGSDTTVFRAPVGAWLDNFRFFAVTLASALNVLGALALIGVVRTRAWTRGRPSSRTIFLSLWVLPAAATFTLIQFGQIGYVLLLLPPLLLLCLPLVDGKLEPGSRAGLPGPALLAALLATLFLTVPMLRSITSDRAGWARISAVVRSLPADRTVVLTWFPQAGSYRVASYLFPQYQVIGMSDQDGVVAGFKFQVVHGTSTFRLDPGAKACPMVAVGAATHLVILDDQVAALVPDRRGWTQRSLPNGVALLENDVPAGIAYLEFSNGRLELVPAGQTPSSVPSCAAMP